jgi:hypothetical protein
VYDDAGLLTEQLQRSLLVDNTRKPFYSTVRISNQIRDANIVATSLAIEPEISSYGLRNYQLDSEFYPDKEDKNLIQAFFRFHPWRLRVMPFVKAIGKTTPEVFLPLC